MPPVSLSHSTGELPHQRARWFAATRENSVLIYILPPPWHGGSHQGRKNPPSHTTQTPPDGHFFPSGGTMSRELFVGFPFQLFPINPAGHVSLTGGSFFFPFGTLSIFRKFHFQLVIFSNQPHIHAPKTNLPPSYIIPLFLQILLP